jgi:hypothetical protein
MSENEARTRAVYDHDNEEPRPAGRRRRQVADWGVGEEIFDHMPGRRFERRPHQDIPRGDAADGRRTIVIETGEDVPATPVQPAADEFSSREEALRAREAHDRVWDGDEPFVGESDVDDVQTEVAEFVAVDFPHAEAASPAEEDGIVRGGVEGRRTVKIGGRPAEWHGSPARARHRPPRAMHERLGPRPDRVAMWAFALGILLILIAIATGNA